MKVIETVCTHSHWDQSLGEELANSISHGLGLVAALIGAPILILEAWRGGDRLFFVGTMIFAPSDACVNEIGTWQTRSLLWREKSVCCLTVM